jgi:mRNA interferase RelE/StbE
LGQGEATSQYQLVLTPKADRNMERLPQHVREQIARKINLLADQPRLGKTLRGRLQGKRSLRAGDYRVIYSVDTAQHKIIIERVGHRQGIYG